MNDAKSKPFAYMSTFKKKSMHTPKLTKKPLFSANNANFASHFPIHTMENGTLKIYSELHKICQIYHPLF